MQPRRFQDLHRSSHARPGRSDRFGAEIRPAREEDMPQIGEIVVEAWWRTFRERLPRSFLETLTYDQQTIRHEHAFLRPGVTYRVAALMGRVLGFASAGPPRARSVTEAHELYAIYLRAGSEGQGLGRSLFERIRADIDPDGTGGLYLTALTCNPNRGFYARLGGIERPARPILLGGISYPRRAYVWPPQGADAPLA